MVDDPELIDLVELEVRERCRATSFPATTSRSCALGRLGWKVSNPEQGHDTIIALMEAVDAYIPQPERAMDRLFIIMHIENVFTISVAARW